VSVYPAVAGHEALGHPFRPVEVGAPDAIGQAVVGGVDRLDDGVLVSERDYIGDGAKDLLAGANVGRVARKQGRRDEEALLVAGGPVRSPFEQGRGALGHASVEVAKHATPLALTHQRPHRGGRVQAGADVDFGQDLFGFCDQLVEHVLVHHPAGSRAAHLA
jgi:hypothetical protein